jgi:tetratricopeptide (TPR) repeat protein
VKCKYSITVWLFLAVLLLVACDNGERQRLQLAELERQNRADSLMLNDSLARDLADWFDRHGTRNEQMRAYYILGRTYADRGEAPAALDAYHEAISRADTTSQDCDFAKLSRVYGQSATIFYQQGLYRNALEYQDLCSDYGYRGKDTLNALRSYAMKAAAYEKLQMADSAIYFYKNAIRLFQTYHFDIIASGFAGGLAEILIDKGETVEAEPYMHDYEQHSGYFDSAGNIAKGREVYYYAKGLYYLKKNNLDSAEYYFRKELQDGKDFNNQNCGSHGLALLYQQKHLSDSAAKYFAYSYAMNDSCFVQMTTHEVAQAKAMYDYSRQQEIAKNKELEADKERSQKERVLYASLALLCLLGYIITKWNRKKKDYQALLVTHQEAEKELSTLYHLQSAYLSSEELHKENVSRLNELVMKKEKEVKRLRETIDKNQRAQRVISNRNVDAIARMKKSEEYHSIQKKIVTGNALTTEDLEIVEKLMSEYFPQFYILLESKRDVLNPNKYMICLLVRLGASPKQISMMLGIHASYVSKAREQMHELFFKTKGSAKDFDKKMIEI